MQQFSSRTRCSEQSWSWMIEMYSPNRSTWSLIGMEISSKVGVRWGELHFSEKSPACVDVKRKCVTITIRVSWISSRLAQASDTWLSTTILASAYQRYRALAAGSVMQQEESGAEDRSLVYTGVITLKNSQEAIHNYTDLPAEASIPYAKSLLNSHTWPYRKSLKCRKTRQTIYLNSRWACPIYEHMWYTQEPPY